MSHQTPSIQKLLAHLGMEPQDSDMLVESAKEFALDIDSANSYIEDTLGSRRKQRRAQRVRQQVQDLVSAMAQEGI